MLHVGTREDTGARGGVPHGKFWQALTVPHPPGLLTNAQGVVIHEHPLYKVPSAGQLYTAHNYVDPYAACTRYPVSC